MTLGENKVVIKPIEKIIMIKIIYELLFGLVVIYDKKEKYEC